MVIKKRTAANRIMSYLQIILSEFDEDTYTTTYRDERSTKDVEIYSIFETAKLTTEIHWGYDVRCIAHIDIIRGKDTTYLEVSSLQKGHTISGKDILLRLENIAKKIGIHHVRLTDRSHFTYRDENRNYSIPLDALSVLCDGQTWYNEKGYIYEKQDMIDTHNLAAICKPLDTIQILQPFHTYFTGKETQPIYEVFREIREKMLAKDTKDIPMCVIVECLQNIQNSEALAKDNPIWLTGEFIYLYKDV